MRTREQGNDMTVDTNKDKPLIQRPSIGRTVVYNHPGSADGTSRPAQSPAIIQHVAEDGSVRLVVFGAKGPHMEEGLTQGDGARQWQWPARVF